MTTISARPAVVSDIPAITSLFNESGKTINVAYLIETALLCVVVVDTGKDLIAGFLCLNDEACYRSETAVPTEREEWLQKQLFPNLSTAVFVKASILHQEYEIEASTCLLKSSFTLLPTVSTILLASAEDISLTEPGLGQYFHVVASDRKLPSYLFSCSKTNILIPLAISRAKVEDHDDMVPVLEQANQLYPALAKLPETSRPNEPYALTRVVSGQDDSNVVVVARLNKQIIGFLVVTTEVDISPLHSMFDLHTYDNFWPSEVYEDQYEQARMAAISSKGAAIKRQWLEDAIKAYREEAASLEGTGTEMDRSMPSNADAEVYLEDLLSSGNLVATEEEIREELVKASKLVCEETEPTIFAITMMCILEEFECQAGELLQAAFDAFPDKEYCVLTLPHESREPNLVTTMTRATPLTGSLFPEVLYLFHRSGMITDFQVRLATAGDAESIASLTTGIPNGPEMQSLFLSAVDLGTAVVACVESEVVGMCTLSPQVDLKLLMANFNLGRLLDLQYHNLESHCEVDIYIMNPIFSHRHRAFLAGAQRLMHSSVLYYAVPPHQQPPDMLDVMLQVPPRHQETPQDMSAAFALYIFNRRQAFISKRAMNIQVVVVGASECGLAAVERLLLDPELSLNYITLLAPGGINSSGVAAQFTPSIISRLGLESRVTMLDAEMVGLDRAAQTILLSDGTTLAYGLLIITAGLQDQTRNKTFEQDPDATGAVVNTTELVADFAFGDADLVGNVLVYGDTLTAYTALQILEMRGASGSIRFAADPWSRSPLTAIVREASSLMQMTMQKPEPLQMIKVESIPGSGKVMVHLKGEEEQSTEFGLVVGCCEPDVSADLFRCLNNASIVYDGRVVVDAAFRTNDPCVYAAGTIAKLSRKYGKKVHFEHYCSSEVGTRLAESVIAGILGTQDPDTMPTLTAAKVIGCNALGKVTFLFAGCPAAIRDPRSEPPEGGEKLSSLGPYGYFQINLDMQQRVHSIIYLGTMQLPANKLSALVGLHASYLNNIHKLSQGDKMCDYLAFLQQPWADILYIDEWPDFRAAMLEEALLGVHGATPASLMEQVQDTTFEFIRTHIGELPNYKLA